MKAIAVIGIAILYLATAASLVIAQEESSPGKKPGLRGPFMNVLDADGNGEISAEEINNAAAALKTLDKDGDGAITKEDLRPVLKCPKCGAEIKPEKIN